MFAILHTYVHLLLLARPFHSRNIMLHYTRQTEIFINAYLLNIHFKKALALAGVWGLGLYLNTLVQPTMDGVFFAVSILGGANDLLVVRVRVTHVLSSIDRIFRRYVGFPLCIWEEMAACYRSFLPCCKPFRFVSWDFPLILPA